MHRPGSCLTRGPLLLGVILALWVAALPAQTTPPAPPAKRPIASSTVSAPGAVLLTGEFRLPGAYAVSPGERMSELILRAGGLTEQAYPFGAVLLRESARIAEPTAVCRAGQEPAAPRERIVVEADPVVLQVRPEQDLVLQPGDSLHMPMRSATVAIKGQVLSPGTLSFRSGAEANHYIEQAGGLAPLADAGRVHVLLPNGAALALKTSYWNFTPTKIPPGSTIVVPPRNTVVLSAATSACP